MDNELITALGENQASFGLSLSDPVIESLGCYYDYLTRNNALLHLVAPCTPTEFAIRHILESIYITKYLQKNRVFADIGSGGGLPGIPCLIARDDLQGFLIESKVKKAGFLGEAVERCGIAARATVIGKQFEEVSVPQSGTIVVRALDKFTHKLPRLLKWAAGRPMILLGSPNLEKALIDMRVRHRKQLIPLSEQRIVFTIVGSVPSKKRK